MNEKQTNKPQSEVHRSSVTVVPQTKLVRPTKRQAELLGFIETFIGEHGYSPSYREIMNGLHYNSVATVALHVGNLIKRGHLVKRNRSARSLEVINPIGSSMRLKLSTNQISDAEEKWLVDKADALCKEAESQAFATPRQLSDIATVLAAMKIIGLGGATQALAQRLQSLKAGVEKT